MVPGLPTPPTDNLYKFQAISGLILVILAAVGLHLQVYAAQARADPMAEEIAVLQVDVAQAREELDRARASAVSPAQHSAFRARHWDLGRKLARAKAKSDALETMVERLVGSIILAIIASVAGLLHTWRGFVYWRDRVQLPQDKLLQRQIATLGTAGSAPPHERPAEPISG